MEILAISYATSEQPRPRKNSGEVITTLPPRLVSFVVGRRRQCSALAFAVLFLPCLFRYWVSYDPNASVSRTQEMPRTALNLHERGQFANPFYLLDTGPSAHLSPAFPVFMALVINTFGEKAAGAFALKLLAALIVAIQVALFPSFSSRLGMGQLNGFIGACIWIVAKPTLVYNWESYYAALLVAVTCCTCRRYLDPGVKGAGWVTWLLGCLFGFLILTVPSFLLVLAAWLALAIWRRKLSFIRTSLFPLVLLPALIVSPWVIRNYLVLHRLMIRDDLGLELSASNNDCGQFSLRKNMDSGCFDNVHPNGSAIEAKKVLELGEVQYNDLRLREALRWIASHPARFIRLTGMRFIAFWFPTENGTIHFAGSGRRLERVLIYLMTLLSLKGLVTLYRRDITSAAVCMSCMALYPLVYYLVAFVDRYRYPILWLTFLLGALPITKYFGSSLAKARLLVNF
jgi:hypothetical protein